MVIIFKEKQFPLCDSELWALGRFVTSLVDDLAEDVFSKADFEALVEAYTWNTNPRGTVSTDG